MLFFFRKKNNGLENHDCDCEKYYHYVSRTNFSPQIDCAHLLLMRRAQFMCTSMIHVGFSKEVQPFFNPHRELIYDLIWRCIEPPEVLQSATASRGVVAIASFHIISETVGVSQLIPRCWEDLERGAPRAQIRGHPCPEDPG